MTDVAGRDIGMWRASGIVVHAEATGLSVEAAERVEEVQLRYGVAQRATEIGVEAAERVEGAQVRCGVEVQDCGGCKACHARGRSGSQTVPGRVAQNEKREPERGQRGEIIENTISTS